MNILDIARTYSITPAAAVSLELAREQRRDIQREKSIQFDMNNAHDADAAYERTNSLPEYVA